jgi:RNase P/RNase MRP subunit p29
MIGKEVQVINNSFYNGMTGRIVLEAENDYLVEFKFNSFFGGLHRVMIFKNEVEVL